MRNIKYIVVHCTATSPFTTVESIQRHWRDVQGWKSPGYHYLIKHDGTIVQLATEDKVTNGVAGYNPASIHISYIGGVTADNKPYDTRTPAQQMAMLKLLLDVQRRYPAAEIKGHRDFPNVAKACPSFDVKAWLKVAV